MTEYNVENYGAVHDGVTDDSDAIQDALDTAATNPGSTVYLPSGTYYCTKALLISSYTEVYGDGMDLTIIVNPSTITNNGTLTGTIGSIGATNVTIRDLQVDHYTNNTVSNGILFRPEGEDLGVIPTGTPTTYGVIQRCKVLGYDSHQYLIWSQGGNHIQIIDCYIDGKVDTYSPPQNDQNGIEIYGGDDVLVSGNTVKNCANFGIVMFSDATATSARSNINITDNTIDKATYGIGGPNASAISNVVISNNTITNAWVTGIVLTDSGEVDFTDIHITYNDINSAGNGIVLLGASDSLDHHTDILVDYNTLVTASAADTFGILCSYYDNTMVNNNTITGAMIGIKIQNGATTTAAYNDIINCQKQGVLLSGQTTLIFTNNSITNYNLANDGSYGLRADYVINSTIMYNTYGSVNRYSAEQILGTCSNIKITNAYYNDSFFGTDSDPLSDNWTTVVSHGGYNIISLTAKGLTGGNNSAFYNGVFTPNQYSQITFPSTSSIYAGVILRQDPTNATATFYRITAISLNAIQIIKCVNNVYTQLGANITTTSTITKGTILRAYIVNNTITAIIDFGSGFVMQGSRTDSSITSGYPGIWGYGTTTSPVDNWEAGNFSEGSLSLSLGLFSARPPAWRKRR